MSDPARLAVSAALLFAPLTIAAAPAAAVPAIVGNTTCQAGDADCNVCAPDVEGQFRGAFGDPGLDWSEKPWRFSWDRRYPPYDIQPTDDFASGVAHHIQGFIRTNEGDSSFGGEGYWLLSRVSLDDGGQIQYQPRSAKVMDQDSDSCWLRGSGTVHVSGGVMRFYCHQRKNIHWWYESDDRFMFEVGEP